MYMDGTKAFRKTESVLVSLQKTSMGCEIFSSTISWWIKGCLIVAFQASGVEIPQDITAHSLRGAATSAVYRSFPSLETIKGSNWKSVHSFTKHYKIDKLASPEVAFGRVVLQHTL